MTLNVQNLFTTERSLEDTRSAFSIPNIKLLRTITTIRLRAEQHLTNNSSQSDTDYQYYGILISSILDMAIQFEDLSHTLDLILDFVKKVRSKFPNVVQPIIEQTLEIYNKRPHPQPVATRMAYSRLKIYLAQFRLEYVRDINLSDIRANVFHCIPIIQELNFITILIKAKQYRKASLFLTEISPLFEIQGQMNILIALPFYELTCLANLGINSFKIALNALDKGKELLQRYQDKSRVSRFITLFEKVITYFEKNPGLDHSDHIVDELKLPGVIFDKIFLHSSYCIDPEGVLVEL